MGKLFVVRSELSAFEAKRFIVGQADVMLSQKGREQAEARAHQFGGVAINYGFTSELARAKESLAIYLGAVDTAEVPVTVDARLNERHLGGMQGKNKTDLVKEFGRDQVLAWLRKPEVRPLDRVSYYNPEGISETFEEVAERTIECMEEAVLPRLIEENGLLVAHSANLRALEAEVEGLDPTEAIRLPVPHGEVREYDVISADISSMKRVA